MEKFLAEAQTSYFWIFALFTFIVGLFVNYSMKPIDAVMGRVSKTWKARAEKKWEGLRDQANTLNDDSLREHVKWLCHAYGQRALWNLIFGIVGSTVVFVVMVSRMGAHPPLHLQAAGTSAEGGCGVPEGERDRDRAAPFLMGSCIPLPTS
jgi:hypothetical protein